ncbi:aldehyde dehydrogenase, partial [Vibrio parahaemolyticus]|uniref:aldehyde dehydrogenase family protein n=1 Tax=Vibrio parahaemolyticus TaxID=670 RepID=UPI00062B13C7
MIYAQPGSEDAFVKFKSDYDNFIGGEWVYPTGGVYLDNISPFNGQVYCNVARSGEADINLAFDAAHNIKAKWATTSVTERSNILLKIEDRIEQHLEKLAFAETWENGKPAREAFAADLPLVVAHFRFFAGLFP